MRPAGHDSPLRGACWDMPAAIADKYFLADRRTEYFQYLTAKTICGGCAVRASCLVEAIQSPLSESIRGGESAGSIQAMHRSYVLGEASAESLAAAALLRQHRSRGVAGSELLRSGQFQDVPLIEGA